MVHTTVSHSEDSLVTQYLSSVLPVTLLVLLMSGSSAHTQQFLYERTVINSPGELLTVQFPQTSQVVPESEPEPTRPLTTDDLPFPSPVFTPIDPPSGFTGPTGILSTVSPNRDYIPMEDRWRLGYPEWDRYGREHPQLDDYPYVLGQWWNPYKQHVLKGDYPIIGQHVFLNLSGATFALFEGRSLPTATTPFESTARPFQEEFFGRPNQFFYTQYFSLAFDLFRGNAAFRPADWRIKINPVFNVNHIDVEELGVVSPDVRKGTRRDRSWWALEEYFAEVKLADLSPEYDFMSLRVGSQPFNSDFRGFIFSDINRGVRLFGTLNGNRDQFNLVYFRQAEKETNSFLNTFDDRRQNIFIANTYHQDTLFPGYTTSFSVHYNNDLPSTLYDRNGFLVRPDPTGVFQRHQIDAVYLGWAGDGHIDRYNITHAFYWVFGRDSLNPLANQAQNINAQMAAVELSYDRDWIRFRSSLFWSSGDGNINNAQATGFDTILDAPQFAGGAFGFWQRHGIPLFGVGLTQLVSFVPNLRSSKFQGQSNFVNPGLFLVNGGFDVEFTPRCRMINNASFLWFDKTAVLEQFLFAKGIDREIGLDLSIGFEYRPLLNNNVILVMGASTLIPSDGFRDLYNRFRENVPALYSVFIEATLAF
jgi:hypothetical protein